MLNSSIRPIERILTEVTTPGQSGPGNNSNEEVLHFSQSYKTGLSPSDGLISYLGHLLDCEMPVSIDTLWMLLAGYSFMDGLVVWLVGFNGISTSIGNLIPETFYTHIIYMICKCKCLGWRWLGFMANWPLKGHWVLNSDMYVCLYI